MSTPESCLHMFVKQSVKVLQQGGIIAYPTEYCFGLGCDPRDRQAVERLLQIKQRKVEQGVILIAGDSNQVSHYADLEQLVSKHEILASWPGPNTWLLPAHASVPDYIRGQHETIAMRIPDHQFCLALLNEFAHPIVSTSANRSGQPEHLVTCSVVADMGEDCDLIVDLPVGGATRASTIRDAITGSTLR